jgi:DNA-binding transcriptional MerR regulator
MTSKTPMPTAWEGVDLGGATYRQLDYWARQGWLNPTAEGFGSGYRRTWPDEEARVARLMVRLIRAGVMPAAAAEYARRMAPSEPYGAVRLELESGVVIEIQPLEASHG